MRWYYMPGVTLLCVCALLYPTRTEAAGWTLDPGSFYFKLYTRTLVGAWAYRADGLRKLQLGLPVYQDYQLNLYAEYGLLDRLNLIAASTPVGFASMDGERVMYIGPSEGGLRWGFLRGKWNLAAEGRYGYAPGVGERAIFDENFGEGEETRRLVYVAATQNHHGDLQLQAGRGFSQGRWFAASLGIRMNSNRDIDHALTGLVQYGRSWSSGWSFESHFMLYEPFGADIDVTNISGVGQTRYLGIGVSGTYWYREYAGIFFGLDGVLYAASNAATPSVALGLEFR